MIIFSFLDAIDSSASVWLYNKVRNYSTRELKTRNKKYPNSHGIIY